MISLCVCERVAFRERDRKRRERIYKKTVNNYIIIFNPLFVKKLQPCNFLTKSRLTDGEISSKLGKNDACTNGLIDRWGVVLMGVEVCVCGIDGEIVCVCMCERET